MGFGAKTVAALVEDIQNDPNMTSLDCTGNSSIKMKGAEGLKSIAEALKPHKHITQVLLGECDIADDGAVVIADIFANNNVIEEIDLKKNKLGAAAATAIADSLKNNTGLRKIDLMSQATTQMGKSDDTLDHFISMFHDNITLQKIVWRLENKKANILNKLLTRNNEIKKRQDKGEDFNAFLPDHMKSGAPPAAAAAADAAAPVTKRASVADMETHIAAIEADHGAELSGDAPEETKTEEAAAAAPAEAEAEESAAA